MIINFIKIAWRHFQKNALYSSINIGGLALGFAASIIIFLYAFQQLSFDQFHNNKDQIFQVYKIRITPTGEQATYDTWIPLLEELKANYAEIASGTRVYSTNEIVQNPDNERFEADVFYVDNEFFRMFNFSVSQGQPHFYNKKEVFITHSLSRKLFGNESAIGKSLRVNFEREYVVSGIVNDPPINSSLQFEMLMPINSRFYPEEYADSWGSSFIETYIMLHDKADPQQLTAKFPQLLISIWNEELASRTKLELLPIQDWYATFVGDPEQVNILILVGLAILLIAVINFINLASAKSSERARETGIRKTLGAVRNHLMKQFLIEAFIYTLVAFLIALAVLGLILPMINTGLEISINLQDLWSPWVLLGIGIVLLLTGLLAGFYPSFIQSGHGVLQVLKGGKLTAGNNTFRNFLVISQFSLSGILIIVAIGISLQVRYLKNNNQAFNQQNALIIPLGFEDFSGTSADSIRIRNFKQSLLQHSYITDVSSSAHVPSQWTGWFTFAKPRVWEEDPLRMRLTFTDASYFKTYQIPIIEGRNFNPQNLNEQYETVVINESAKRAFNWNDIENKYVTRGSNAYEVIGVVQDYNFETLKNEIAPLLHFFRIPENSIHGYLTVRYQQNRQSEVIKHIQQQWSILDDTRPLDFDFLDESVARMYAVEQNLFRLIINFTIVAIIIAYLGLIGLTSYQLDKRKKELVIRKIMGASQIKLIGLLSFDILKLFLIVLIISIPIGNYFITDWLQDFAIRISLPWWLFLLPVVTIFLVAFSFIGMKLLQASRVNPVEHLRYE